jgi:hypothetical protein
MDSDDDLRGALELGCRFAVLRVRTIARDRQGTRSQTTRYEVAVERAIDEVPSPLSLKHFGVPLLEADALYVAGVADTGRHHGAWEVRFALKVAGDVAEAVTAFAARRAKIV